MALVAVASDKGAPGVTTASVVLAAGWPRPVLLAGGAPARAAALDGRDRLTPPIGVGVTRAHKRFHAALAEGGEAVGPGKGLVNGAGGLAYDPRAARQLRGEWGGRLDKSLLART